MVELDTLTHFEALVLPHLSAAYNLARWPTRNDHDAEDLVQDAYLRALSPLTASMVSGTGAAGLWRLSQYLLHLTAAKPQQGTPGSA